MRSNSDPIPGVPAIPAPGDTIESLNFSVGALKQAVENLTGQIGDPLDRVITVRDLLRFNILTAPEVDSNGNGPKSFRARQVEFERLRARVAALDGLP